MLSVGKVSLWFDHQTGLGLRLKFDLSLKVTQIVGPQRLVVVGPGCPLTPRECSHVPSVVIDKVTVER